MIENYKNKYLKYKNKYLELKQHAGAIKKKSICNGYIYNTDRLIYIHPQLVTTNSILEERLKNIINNTLILDKYNETTINVPCILETLPIEGLYKDDYMCLISNKNDLSPNNMIAINNSVYESDYNYIYIEKLEKLLGTDYIYREYMDIDSIKFEFIIFPDIKHYYPKNIDECKLCKFNLVIACNEQLLPITIYLDNDNMDKVSLSERLKEYNIIVEDTIEKYTRSEINTTLLNCSHIVIKNFNKSIDEDYYSILACCYMYNRYMTLSFRYINKYYESEFLTYQRSQQWMVFNKFILLVKHSNKINLIAYLKNDIIRTNTNIAKNNIKYQLNMVTPFKNYTKTTINDSMKNDSIKNDSMKNDRKEEILLSGCSIISTNITYQNSGDYDLYQYIPSCITTILVKKDNNLYSIRLISQLFNNPKKDITENTIMRDAIEKKLIDIYSYTNYDIKYRFRISKVNELPTYMFLKYGPVIYDKTMRLSPLKILRIIYALYIYNNNTEDIKIMREIIKDNNNILEQEYYFSENGNYYIQYRQDTYNIYVLSYLPKIEFKNNKLKEIIYSALIDTLNINKDYVLSDEDLDRKFSEYSLRELINITNLNELFESKDFKYDMKSLNRTDMEEINTFVNKFILFMHMKKPVTNIKQTNYNNYNNNELMNEFKDFNINHLRIMDISNIKNQVDLYPYGVWAHYPVSQANLLFHMQISNFHGTELSLRLGDSIFRGLNNTIYRWYTWDFIYNITNPSIFQNIDSTYLMPDIRSYDYNVADYEESIKKKINSIAKQGFNNSPKFIEALEEMKKKLIFEFRKILN